jgi:hypothetical protein
MRIGRPICGLLIVLMLSSCSPAGLSEMQRNITLAAQQQLQRTLANHFTRKLGDGIDLVLGRLSSAGGYLDNPLVRVLLPPPMGLVLSVARDLHTDPQGTILEQLMNHAAEAAIPGAGPVLRAAVKGITTADAEILLQDGATAAADYLMAHTRDVLLETLSPVVAETLEHSGANEIYAGALRVYELQRSLALAGETVLRESLPEAAGADVQVPMPDHPLDGAVETVLAPELPPEPGVVTGIAGALPDAAAGAAAEAAFLLAHEPPRDLGAYVTGKAVDGLFNALAQQEQLIRRELQSMAGGFLPSS